INKSRLIHQQEQPLHSSLFFSKKKIQRIISNRSQLEIHSGGSLTDSCYYLFFPPLIFLRLSIP
ncbi:MAG: hypothetical protein ACRCY5_00090, partial [Phocaeicola sp.]